MCLYYCFIFSALSAEDRRRYEQRIIALEEEVEEEQSNLELAQNKYRTAQQQVIVFVVFVKIIVYL
jgi:hypothetical protein